MKTAVVTGANRGIGLELVRGLQKQKFEVIGVCRKSSDELEEVASQVIDGIDVSSDQDMSVLKKALKGVSIDVLINNAGLLESTSISNFDFKSMERQFQVNALGPLRVTYALLPNINPNGRVLNITSRMGSIADNTSGGSYGYRMSKAALNIATVSLSHDLLQKDIAVGLVHPGYVKTEMTGFSGHLTPEESAKGILERLEELDFGTAGTFWHSNGEILPW